jgi:hypothetical protein
VVAAVKEIMRRPFLPSLLLAGLLLLIWIPTNSFARLQPDKGTQNEVGWDPYEGIDPRAEVAGLAIAGYGLGSLLFAVLRLRRKQPQILLLLF